MTCVFCPENWDNLDIVADMSRTTLENGVDDNIRIIKPLNPVTEGHVLVIHRRHTDDFSKDFFMAAELAQAASAYVRAKGIQANIITSIGPAATQTVKHTHIHVVPRTEGDGLPLPWTIQHQDDTDRVESACLNGNTLRPGVYVLKREIEL